MKRFFLLFVIGFIYLHSSVPSTISWQGILTDENGNLLNGSYLISAKLYDSETATTGLWSETQTVTITDGLTNLILGESVAFDPIHFKEPLWLEITIGSGTPLTRIKLTAVPYAMTAKNVDDESITYTKLQNASGTNGTILIWDGTQWEEGSETDPVFESSTASGIAGLDITNWNAAFGWGDHASAGYLTSYTESDPIFTSSASSTITNDNLADWNTAYGWGDHSTAGYLTSYSETDPIYSASDASSINSTNITDWNTSFGWGDHSTAGYLTNYTETDPSWTGSANISGNISRTGNVGIGISAPTALLHTSGTGTGEGNILFEGELKGADPGDPPFEGAGTRMMWYPDKAAFRVGRVTSTQWDKDSIGQYSFASGHNTTASGSYSTAMGGFTTASGSYSTAMGGFTTASGSYSTAMGYITTASDYSSTAMGYGTAASGDFSTAMGYATTASGSYSSAMGYYTTASGSYSTAMGGFTTASGSSSTAMGYYTTASGDFSTAMGVSTTASGDFSTAMGVSTTAPSGYETVIGRYNTIYTPASTTSWSTGDRLFVIGKGTSLNDKSNALTVLKNGNTGIGTSTPTALLHTSGNGTGEGNILFEGELKGTDPGAPPLEGAGTRMMWYPDKSAFRVGRVFSTQWDKDSIGYYSVAMGFNTKASGSSSTAMGFATTASGNYSTAMGFATTAPSAYETVIGRYNTTYNPSSASSWVSSDRLFVIGSGTADNDRNNAMTIIKNGNTGIGTSTPTALLHTSGTGTSEGNILFEGELKVTNPGDPPLEGAGTRMMWYPDKAAFRVGRVTSTQWDKDSIGQYSFASGHNTTASGYSSTAMGGFTTASGSYSTAMGYITTASDYSSTAMGYGTAASGSYSTAMGRSTTASGLYSTAIGRSTTASGYISTAMGYNTEAPSYNEFVAGRYNDDYTPNSSTSWNTFDRLFVIGNGTSSTSTSNALTVLKNGRIGLQDEVTPLYAFELTNNSNYYIGRARAYAWDTYSDGRLKTDRNKIPYGLNEIMKIEPIKYFHHHSSEENGELKIKDDGTYDIGFIAQDMYKIIPEIVTKPEDEESELWGMNYEKLTPVLVKAMQEQQQIIEEQNKKITKQQKEIDDLKNKYNEIMKMMNNK